MQRTFGVHSRPLKVALVAAAVVLAILLVRHWVHQSESYANQRTQDAIAACIRREQASNSTTRTSALIIEKCKKEAGVA